MISTYKSFHLNDLSKPGNGILGGYFHWPRHECSTYVDHLHEKKDIGQTGDNTLIPTLISLMSNYLTHDHDSNAHKH